MSTQFYLSKDSNTVGPCTLADLRDYLAYGSVTQADFVRRADENSWTELGRLEELAVDEGRKTSEASRAGRRRVTRYRDYHRVPHEQRAGWVLKRLICGFLFFPPLLWRSAVSVYQGMIFTKSKNDQGYLTTWSRRAESLVSLVLIVNSLLWLALILWFGDHGGHIAREILSASRTGLGDLQDWLGHH